MVRRIFLCLLFLLAQGVFFTSELFTIHDVSVTGLRHLHREAILTEGGLREGISLWAVTPKSVERRLNTLHQVEQASVSFEVPGRVDVVVQERPARYLAAMMAAKPTWFEIDREGVVLRPAGKGNKLPRLLVEQAVIEGTRIDPVMVATGREAVAWVEGILPDHSWFYQVDRRYGVTVKSTVQGTPLTIKLGQMERMEYKMSVLKALLARQKNPKEKATAIDLRYASPVIKLLNPPKRDPEDALE